MRMDGAWTQVIEYVQKSDRGLQHRMLTCSLSDQSDHMEVSTTEPTLLCKLRHTYATPADPPIHEPTNPTHLSPDSMQPTEIAQLLKTTATDRTLSLDNQQLALYAIAECKWFENDVPAVIQSQVLALLSEPTLVIGLFVPLTMRHKMCVTSPIRMISKAINTGKLTSILHTLCHEISDRVLQTQMVGDGVFHVLDALANAMPVARVSHAWMSDWTRVLVASVACNKESKKLAALMLRFVNKFGTKDTVCREQIDGAARALTTPLKKAVVAAIARHS
ncbi:hypothetical protein GGH96_003713 [Coemansia sp. RSA 1972]|nr:hypothetical protein GGH96_003713 [Coemansia sp. RSA 1972]